MLLSLFTAFLVPAFFSLQTLASPVVRKPAQPLSPLQDPWYTAPNTFEEKRPGAVLRIRQAPGNLTSLFANCCAAYNILYRTTDDRFQPSWAVTTVLIPETKSPALLSYQIPYDSAYLGASPSYSLYSSDTSPYRDEISIGLSYGWFVNVPDFEGPLASFTAGIQAGHATIDSIRAVLSAHKRIGLAKDSRYAMWGYSGGGLASEWAAELQAQYAPELNFSGAALGGLTPNITTVLFAINRAASVGLAPASFLGKTSQYPEGREFLLSRLNPSGPYNATGFLAALNYTLNQLSVAYAYQDIGAYFVGGIDDLVSVIPQRIGNLDGMLGYHGIPQMPLFVYKAIADELSVVDETDSLVARYCNIGVNILYHRNTIGGHTADFFNGRPAAVAWLRSVLGGTYGQNYSTVGCITEDLSVNITDTPD